jgi:adenylate cyclase
MTEERAKRKLSGILSADAVGYSRLMRLDEAATIATLKKYREIMALLIQKYHGRVVDSPGDNILAEFASVVDAVDCAVEIQKELKNRNKEAPDDRKMEFRIGIHLGDVIEDDERIYGDGVNIAARIEGLSEQGSICISRTTYESVKDKLSLGYEYLGEHTVKNIPEPVIVYKVLMEPEAAGKVIGEKRFLGRISRRAAISAIIILIVVAGGLTSWNFYLRQSQRVEPASLDRMAFQLPEKPSIAVLPFDNMSAEPEQEYFSDGLTEEIINALAKAPKMFVIARNSSFTYKGKPVKVQQVSEELGVRYVLEGSVRISGDQVRISTQLIDAIKGHHLWSERYDRNMKDIFAIQDEITMKIITAMRVKLTEGEQARIRTKGAKNLKAYLKWLEGIGYIRHVSREGNILAKQAAEEVIRLDPETMHGYSLLASAHIWDVWLRMSKSPQDSFKKAIELAQKAIEIDPSQADPHRLLAHVYIMMRRYDAATAEAEKAVEMEPGSADPHATLGHVLLLSGRPQEAITRLENAMRLNPFPQSWYYHNLGSAYSVAGRDEEAIPFYKKALEQEPNNQIALSGLIVSYSLADRLEEARGLVKELLRLNPKYCIKRGKGFIKDEAATRRRKSAMRKAGLPDCPNR